MKINKKAMELVETTVLNLVFIVLILFVLLAGVMKVTDNTIHDQRALSRDFAFTYDTIQLMPGKINIEYQLPANFSLSLSKACIVQVSEKKKNIPVNYFCNQYDGSISWLKKGDKYFLQKNL